MNNKRRGTGAAKNNTLRIIAGRMRGSRLAFVDAEGLRPTSDRARETVFNWLARDVAGARCLDLFAGSGALSFEALSRGAAHVQAIELNRQAVSLMRSEAQRLSAPNLDVNCSDALAWLARAPALSERGFDVVFIDPPFDAQLQAPACLALENAGLLAEDAAIYVESPASMPAPAVPSNWQLHRERRIGDVRCVLYYRTKIALGDNI